MTVLVDDLVDDQVDDLVVLEVMGCLEAKEVSA
jgi:hypothetical protein